MTQNLALKNQELGQDNFYESTTVREKWEPLHHDVHADVVVIGAGLAGLSCALELAERGRSVVVLEAERVCSHASGRNGGQVITGFACGQQWLEKHLGVEAARKLWHLSLASIKRMQERMERHQIACDPVWSYITVATSRRKAKALAQDARHMQAIYGHDMRYVEGVDLREHIDSQRYVAGLIDPASGHIHPLRYGLGIAKAAARMGVRIHENTRATHMQSAGQGWEVKTPEGYVRADHVVLASNCGLLWHAPQLAERLHARIMPVGTYIVATQPLAAEVATRLLPSNAAVCDNNFVLDYFRLSADNRLLFGGKVSYTTATPSQLTASMKKKMCTVFPALEHSSIDHTWGGFVDISRQRAPDWGTLGKGVYYVQGFSGHGLAATTLAGTVISEAIVGKTENLEIFKKILQDPFPGSNAWRTPLLLLGTSYYRLMDALT